MNLLAIDRSTDTQSAALAVDGKVVASRVFAGSDARSGDWPLKIRSFLEANGVRPADVDETIEVNFLQA